MKKETMTITKEEINDLRTFVQKQSGLFLPESLFLPLSDDIERLYRDSRQTSFSRFTAFLSQKKGRPSLNEIISLLTADETLFFRTSSQFEILKHNIFPKLLEQASATKKITVWSAGCSTGEEPYSVAFFLQELIADIDSWEVKIVATDIDRTALKKAKEGKYPKWAFRGVDKRIIGKYFKKEGEDYTIEQKYRSMVQFSNHNLLSASIPGGVAKKSGIDLIICRNVTAYFEAKATKKLAGSFFGVLKNNGYLLVGKREHSSRFYTKYSTRFFPGAVIYKKNIPHSTSKARKKKRSDDNEFDPIDQVIENETRTLLSVIKENDLSELKANGGLSLHEHRKGSGKNTEETLIFDLAIQFFNEKKYDKAIDSFLEIVDINSSNMRACWMLCHIYAASGLYDEAIAWGTRCIEVDPLNKAPYYTLALSYIGKGRLNEAADKIKKAIYIDPKFTLGYFTLGNIYILLHLKSQADSFSLTKESLYGLPEELSFKTKNISVSKLLDELQLKPRSFRKRDSMRSRKKVT